MTRELRWGSSRRAGCLECASGDGSASARQALALAGLCGTTRLIATAMRELISSRYLLTIRNAAPLSDRRAWRAESVTRMREAKQGNRGPHTHHHHSIAGFRLVNDTRHDCACCQSEN